MSLLDTIKGAREEAEQAGTLIGGAKEKAATAGDEQSAKTGATPQGYARKTAANARPTREKAGSVRTGGKSSKEMTKEEKRAERERQRTEEDLAYDTKKVLLEQVDGYKRTQRIWWGLLIAGIVCTLIGWGAMSVLNQQNAGTSGAAVASIVMMVLAYGLVIGAFIYDMIKVRPMRNAVNEQVNGMTKKRMRKVLDDNERRKAAEKAKK